MGFYIFDKNGNYIEKPHTFTAEENEYFSLEELMNKIYNEYPRYNHRPQAAANFPRRYSSPPKRQSCHPPPEVCGDCAC